MKKNSLIPAMTGVLLILTAVLVVATIATIQFSRRARSIQADLAGMNFTKMNVEALIRDTAVYAQSNRAVEPILMTLGVKPVAPATGTRTPTR